MKPMVRDYSDQPEYKLIISELLELETAELYRAKDENDYSKMTIGVYELANYITTRTVDIIEHIAEKEWREDSRDHYMKEFGIPKEVLYEKKKVWKKKWKNLSKQ